MRQLLRKIKKAVVFLGEPSEDGTPLYSATGFLIDVGGILHLATAKHVVVEPKTGRRIDENLEVYFDLKKGHIGSRPIKEIKHRFGVDWIFHANPAVDIAAIPFGLNTDEDDVVVVPEDRFLNDLDQLLELYDVFFVSYQPGIEPQEKLSPVIRHGTIARTNEDGTIYVDGAAFPGNSGSPVFLKPSTMRFTETGITIGGDKIGGMLIGIIGSYIPYQEVAISQQTGLPRVIFEENTGLSKVWSVSFMRELTESRAFSQQLAFLKEMTTNGK